jgi:formylglycine-generating enzyme required for sulfatase activity
VSGSNLPAASITWYQAAAFVNYLNTSTGHAAAYNLNSGATALTLWSSTDAWRLGGENLFRHKDAFYFLPRENEWYKAAYFNPSGSSYNLYPTGSSIPTAVSGGDERGHGGLRRAVRSSGREQRRRAESLWDDGSGRESVGVD